MLRWKLREVMARVKMTNRELAQVLGVHETSVSRMKTADTMPRIDGDTLNHLCNALNYLYKEKGVDIVISPADLFEYVLEEIGNSSDSSHEPISN
ncbi:conserved hypothetical protein [Hyella patelloides LEGE 07179]|uniref:HTH cro/C1-type domain-containing protein n=1 Tax=Hyella patelloides LEGE 07179 TaxID=945734 RepID=A0A563W220_9CYAN|nr:helix-turn-helix transcriptional regulator [Hyella patelloides]VEP17685.1 conserved hypothetical protein [Hyella patelloides LEGE 07179]